MSLPEDVERWPAGPRLLRCMAVGSKGDPERLRYLVGLLQIDYRDVIVAGEYEPRGRQLVHVHDFNQPIP